MVNRSNPEQDRVSFVEILSPGSRSELKLFHIIAIKALQTLIWERISTIDALASTNFLMLGLTLSIINTIQVKQQILATYGLV